MTRRPLPLPADVRLTALTEFTRRLAARLPGQWQYDLAAQTLAEDPAAGRIWDGGPLAFESARPDAHRRVLTHPYGLQLYVMPRPSRPHQYLVLPMLPAGTGHQHVEGLHTPRGIAVPADPARAAAAVRRRLGSPVELLVKALPAWRRASTGHRHISVTFPAQGDIRVHCVHPSAMYELLQVSDFWLDPGTGECRLPNGLWREEAARHLVQTVNRLRGHGYRVSLHTGRRTGGPASAPAAPPKAPGR